MIDKHRPRVYNLIDSGTSVIYVREPTYIGMTNMCIGERGKQNGF